MKSKQVACLFGARDDMPNIPGAELSGDHGRGSAGRRAQRAGHLRNADRSSGAHVDGFESAHRRLDRQAVRPRHVADLDEIAHLTSVLENPRWFATFERGAKHRSDTGVRSIAWHERPVHIVVPQCHNRSAGRARPREREVFLRELARRIETTRTQWRRLVDEFPLPRRTGFVDRVEAALPQVVDRPGHLTCAAIPTLAVHHHRRGQDQPGTVRSRHRTEQYRGSEVVVRSESRCVQSINTGPDDRRLMTHDVDARQRFRECSRISDVATNYPRSIAVSRCHVRVEFDDIVAIRAQLGADRRSDETRRPRQQHTHGLNPDRTTEGEEPQLACRHERVTIVASWAQVLRNCSQSTRY